MNQDHANPQAAAPVPPSTSPPTPMPQAADTFMSSLADLESRISALKSLHEHAAGRETSLLVREKELVERESAATAQSTAAERERQELAVARANFEAMQDQAGQEHRRRTEELERKAHEVAERERALLARLDERERSLDTRLTEIESRQREAEAAAAAQRAEIAEALARANDARARAEAESQRAREEDDRRQAELAERERSLAARLVKAEAELARAAAEQEEADKERAALESLAAEAERRERELAEAREQAEAERRRLETALAEQAAGMQRREHDLKEQEFDIQRLREEIESERASVAEHARTLAEQMKRSDDEQSAAIWSNRMESIQLQLGESNAARARLETELAQRTAEIESLTREVIEANQNRQDPDATASRDHAIAELRAQVEEARATVARLTEQASAAHAAGQSHAAEIAARDERIQRLEHTLSERGSAIADEARRELSDRDATITDLRARLAEAERLAGEQAVARQNAAGDAEGELAAREQAIVLLKERLDAAAAENAALAEKLAAAEQACTRSPAGGPTEADLCRRDRLRKYKSMLQAQARKIMAAQSALQRRHADCEAVLTNRAKLAELAHQLARAEKKLTAGKARSGAAAAMLYLVAMLSILAVMSWEVSKRVWPGTYIARAVLEADAGRRTPKPEDLAAWQKDNEELFADPRLVEIAAERMERRGLATIGTPADLSDRLKKDLYLQAGRPGSLTVELRGEGAEKTALVLDTLVTSFKVAADQAREQRANDIGITIAQAAASGAEPLMDKRLERAGGVFGGAALAAGLGMLVIWSRMVRAKRKFDQAAAVEAALGEVDWATLEASIKQHSGKPRPQGEPARG